jgi:hypothetical protein
VAALLAAGNGMLVGTVIWLLCRLSGRDVLVLLRIVVGIAFSFCSSVLYLLLVGGFYGDVKRFLLNSFLLALTFGAFAGALARGKRQEEFLKEDHDKQLAGNQAPLWSFLWRGAVGGVLGLIILVVYLFVTDPYRLNGLEIAALIAAANGLSIGAIIFFLGRMLERNVRIGLRMIVGMSFSVCSMTVYSYLGGGYYGDFRWFVSNVVLLSLTLGALPSVLARARSRNTI